MKIAVIGPLELPGSGGVKIHCEEIGARLAARGHDVTVLVSRGKRRRTHRGMTIRRVGRLPLRHLDRLAYSLMASLHVLFRRYDVVHFHSFASSSFAGLARRRARHLVVTAHRVEWRDGKWGRVPRALLRHCERSAMRHAHLVISVSQALADELLARYPGVGEIHWVSNGVDLSSPSDDVVAATLDRRGLTPDRFVLVVGRFQPEKGLDTIIAAWEQLIATHDDTAWRLVIAGDARHRTPYVQALHEHATQLAPTVQLTGVIGRVELTSLYQHAGLVVSASRQEGQPLTVMEGMVAGRPLLLSDIPAHLELCGDSAEYFPTGDADRLVSGLRDLIESPERRERLRARAAALAATLDFDWDHSAERTEALLLDLAIRPQR